MWHWPSTHKVSTAAITASDEQHELCDDSAWWQMTVFTQSRWDPSIRLLSVAVRLYPCWHLQFLPLYFNLSGCCSIVLIFVLEIILYYLHILVISDPFFNHKQNLHCTIALFFCIYVYNFYHILYIYFCTIYLYWPEGKANPSLTVHVYSNNKG